MTDFERGEIVLVPFPFTDLTDVRQRPGIIISPGWYNSSREDVIVAAITSQIPSPTAADEMLLESDDLTACGLPKRSVIRTGKLFTIQQNLIRRRLGNLPDPRASELDSELQIVAGLSPQPATSL